MKSLLLATAFFFATSPAFSDTIAPPPAQVTIKLSVADWQTVINGLGELKTKDAMPVIEQIQAQAKDQINPTEKAKK